MSTPRLPASGNTSLPGQLANLASGFIWRSPRAKHSSSIAEPRGSLCTKRTPGSAEHRARFIPPVRPPVGCVRPRSRLLCRCRSRRGGDPAAPPWGRSRWSGQMSLGRCAPREASGRHTCQRPSAARGPRVEKGAPGEDAARAPAATGDCRASTGSGLVLPPYPLAIACLLQAAPRGWLPASLMPIGFFSWELGSALLWGVVFLSSSVLVFDVLTL